MQVRVVNDHLSSLNVKLNLLPTQPSEQILQSSSLWDDNCTIKKRITLKTLAIQYASEVDVAQRQYISKLSEAEDNLSKNVRMVCKMDSMFGVEEQVMDEVDDGRASNSLRAKDGNLILTCPVLSCQTKTVKLKRHLHLKHREFSDTAVNYAIHSARVIEKNKDISSARIEQRVSQTSSRKRNQVTNLVNRRHNHKKCLICSNLYKNMGEHISSVHKINPGHEQYDNLVKTAPVVPPCYIRHERGKAVMLEGEDLEIAMKSNEEEVGQQESALEELKSLRAEMAQLSSKIAETENIDEYRNLKAELKEVELQYKNARFKDSRKYSCTTQSWRDSFLTYLKHQRNYSPERSVRMAMDVILPFEEKKGEPLQFRDITDARTIRTLLETFSSLASLSCATKLKHLSIFEVLVKFLITDCDSPEALHNGTSEEILLREASWKNITYEIESCRKIISKAKGEEGIASSKKAADKLLSEEDMEGLMEDLLMEVRTVLSSSDEDIANFTTQRVLNFRNVLMAIPTLRLGRRSKELMTLQLSEVENSERASIEGESFFVIKVAKQKGAKIGKEAPIAYTDEEFKALQIFINKMRPKIADSFQTNVFPFKKNMKHGSSKDGSLASAWRILQSFQTPSGKKLSSRTIRSSRITNRNKYSLTDAQKRDLADSMNHSVSTADRYYNYSSVTDSVVRTLSLEKRIQSVNSPNVPSSTPIQPQLQEIASQESMAAGPSGVERNIGKRKLFVSESESEPECPDEPPLDSTLLTLRRKKIMKSSTEINKKEKDAQLEEIKDKVKVIVTRYKNDNKLNSLLTKNGAITIQPLKKVLSKNVLKLFSAKELRALMAQEMSTQIQ